MRTLLLNRSEVQGLLDMEKVIAAIEDAYRAFSRGEVLQPPIMSIEIPEHNGEIDFKAGYCRNNGVISMKGASGYYDNQRTRGIPNSLGTVLLFDTTGMAVQDNLTATMVYDAAKVRGIGLFHDFMA